MAEDRKRLTCAIYTRKSSEEGLEQSFNSLEAQREACEAYIASQRHEGWQLSKTRYDDGGFSGGSMERPGLQRLLDDIRSRKVDVVVVYKVDRLTRALSDFAKIVETFDGHGVFFVSVTQQFNTTTSMGRLTLNVLLSFAQFEREVTGERIRDKFAASRRKGMWMGGPIPLGYDLKDRKLVINPAEAETVREIFRLYAEYRCVRRLKVDLNNRGVLSKRYVSETGRAWGGLAMGRGQLYYILRNHLYIGEATHKGRSYPGEHESIIDQALWAQVQTTLEGNRYKRRAGLTHKDPSYLAGLLFDHQGNRFSPSHTQRHGRRYRYYVSQAVLQHRQSGTVRRIPAHELENIAEKCILDLLRDTERIASEFPQEEEQTVQAAAARLVKRLSGFDRRERWGVICPLIKRIELHRSEMVGKLSAQAVQAELFGQPVHDGRVDAVVENGRSLIVKAQLDMADSRRTKVPANSDDQLTKARNTVNRSAAKSIARAFEWFECLERGETIQAIADRDGLDPSYVARVLPLRFLAPKIVQKIIQYPVDNFNFAMKNSDIPFRWYDQNNNLKLASL